MVSIRSATDYSPFGVQLENRNFLKTGLTEDYRMGFQGQEEDDEVKGEGNSVNYKFRMHDPRLGRFFAIDPLAAKYPDLSPYNFVANNPIIYVDPDGRAIKPANGTAESFVQSYFKDYTAKSKDGRDLSATKIFGVYSTQTTETFGTETHTSPVWTSSYSTEKAFKKHLKEIGIKTSNPKYDEIITMWNTLAAEDVMEVMVIGPDQTPTIEQDRESSSTLSGANHYLTRNDNLDSDLTSAYSGGVTTMASTYPSPKYYSNDLYQTDDPDKQYSSNIVGAYVIFIQPQGNNYTTGYEGESMQDAFNRNMGSIIENVSNLLNAPQ